MTVSNTALLSKPKTHDRNRQATETLNFKVTPDFKKEFKVYAASQGISMVDLLKEGFILSRQKRK
jgi:lipid-binding SYLF domain-containing protein